MNSPMSDARFTEIAAMQFTTGFNAACGHFETDVERELYAEAVRHQNARVELVNEVTWLRAELETVEQQLDNLDRRPARDERPTYCNECRGRRDLPRTAEGPCNCDARPR